MLYPDNIDYKLGFSAVKQLIKENCLSPMGSCMAEKIRFISNYDLLVKLLNQTAEFKSILEFDSPFPSKDYADISIFVKKMKSENSSLSEGDFFLLRKTLRSVFEIIFYFRERETLYPSLQYLIKDIHAEKQILQDIDDVIDQNGKTKISASLELGNLSKNISAAQQELQKKIDGLFKTAQKEGWTSGNPTLRNGHSVIPVLSEHKRKIKGFVLDESSSGQTVFIEPVELVDLNNKISNLEFERKREIVRILTSLTNKIKPFSPVIFLYNSLIAKIDFIRAKALLAIKLDGCMPSIYNKPCIRLVNARHPFLMLSLKKTGTAPVPLNINIDETNRITLISGPNAGGKSVCMKTVGLLQLMLQAGLLIPVDESSEMGVFKRIFADIGDDQSIESDLSTYSAHLTKMRYFLEHAGGKCMILIDEFGAGTDPNFGGPIAEAVLQTLNQKNVKGIITTHYSNLKIFAENTPGLVNASMLFDSDKMKPLYILQSGKPGSSYALEIARRTGLPTDVLKSAQIKIGRQQNKMDSLLADLESEKKRLYEQKVQLQKNHKEFEALKEENQKQKKFLDENKKHIINDAKKEAKLIIEKANKLVENTIALIKESKAEKSATKTARENMARELGKIKIDKPFSEERKKEAGELKIGDWVRFTGSKTEGKIIGLSKSNATIAIGEIMSVVKTEKLEKITPKPASQTKAKSVYADYKLSQTYEFKPEIDLRGLRGNEALQKVESFIDQAIITGCNNLRILHGKGDGILRKLIRDYLKKYAEVENIEDEHPDRGGYGITIVKLK